MLPSGLSPDFEATLRPIFRALAERLGVPAFTLQLDTSTHAVRVEEAVVHVPLRFEVHWRRFHTVPTDLVRDAAYRARREAQEEADDADTQAFAEAFLRDHVLSTD